MPILRRLTLALLLASLGSGAALAQSGYYPQQQQQQQPRRDPRAYPPGYYPGKLVQPAQPQQGFSLRRFFGAQEQLRRPSCRRPSCRPRRPAPPPAAVAKQEKPKVDPSTHVVVFGDSLADFARQGLDAHFAENQDVEVVAQGARRWQPRARRSGRLAEFHQGDPRWRTEDHRRRRDARARATGSRSGRATRRIEPLSDRWKDALPAAGRRDRDRFQGARDPRGLDRPAADEEQQDLRRPRRHERDLQGERPAQRRRLCGYLAGLRGRREPLHADGPDVDGEPAKLRTNDGIFFTRAGSRKVALSPTRRSSGSSGRAERPRLRSRPANITPADGIGRTVHRGGDSSSAGRRCTGDSAVEAAGRAGPAADPPGRDARRNAGVRRRPSSPGTMPIRSSAPCGPGSRPARGPAGPTISAGRNP